MTASIPPGWYDDPSAPGMERWWDGNQWTESSRPRSDAPSVPPAPASAPGFGAEPMPPGGIGGPGAPPPFPPGYGPYPPMGPPPAQKRNRGLVLGLVALLVVGGLIAILVFALGGGGGGGTATSGRLADPTTGVSVPQIKGWEHTDKHSPTHQIKDRIPCSDESSNPSLGPSDSPSDSSDESESHCYLGEIEVGAIPGKSFDSAVSKMSTSAAKNSGFKITKTTRDERIKIDGKDAHILVYEVEDKKGSAKRSATVQFIVIDASVEDGGSKAYPIVFTGVDHDSKAPDKSVLDTVRNGIKVGQPTPTDSAS
ncbi:DUF2510 domain-containing protein [Yinghuangia seranimata]|uniref:DUF2510 domain-containing protein n=1 Tax=Yinghuangia seranimata TaxID=408067 RepID=UPI00248AC8CC|nr:DUF2510 domain-containing protein [Yinghuangia seranimata]MDI2128663.1 DUF2510 domain-containing protein [Yinghuangia seranimata]